MKREIFRAGTKLFATMLVVGATSVASAGNIVDDQFDTGLDGWTVDSFMGAAPVLNWDGVSSAEATTPAAGGFWSIGMGKIDAVLDFSSAGGNLANITYDLNASGIVTFGGVVIPGQNAGFTVRVFAKDAVAGNVTSKLEWTPSGAGNFSETFDNFTLTDGPFDLNAPAYDLYVYTDVGGLNAWGQSDGTWGQTVDFVEINAIPEPATLSLLMACGLCVIGRRKRG